MEFIDIHTEQTTAVTDAMVALMVVAAAVYLNGVERNQRWKAVIWVWVFALLALSAILGAVIHGFKMPVAYNTFLWHPLYLALGLLVALFVVGAVYDVFGEAVSRRILPTMMAVGVGFFGITLVFPDSFLIFVIYEAVAMLFALGGYTWVAYRGHLEGAWLVVAGVLVTIIAAAVQASTFSFTFIWSFDHNGVYHLIQMVGIVLLVSGLGKSLRQQ